MATIGQTELLSSVAKGPTTSSRANEDVELRVTQWLFAHARRIEVGPLLGHRTPVSAATDRKSPLISGHQRPLAWPLVPGLERAGLRGFLHRSCQVSSHMQQRRLH